MKKTFCKVLLSVLIFVAVHGTYANPYFENPTVKADAVSRQPLPVRPVQALADQAALVLEWERLFIHAYVQYLLAQHTPLPLTACMCNNLTDGVPVVLKEHAPSPYAYDWYSVNNDFTC